MEKVRYHEMLPHEIVARRKKFPAAFIGVGTLEWHGEHLAVGNDALKAEKLCDLAAAKSGGFAFPTVWYGDPRNTWLMEAMFDTGDQIKKKMGFPQHKFTEKHWGQAAQEHVDLFDRLIYHILVEMNQLEMRAVCLMCGHYPLARGAAGAIERFNKKFKDTQAFAAIEPCYVQADGKHPHSGGDHAAKWETSYLWYLRPDCVDMGVYLGRDPEEKLVGVGGIDPRKEATIEVGRKGCRLIVDGMVRKAKELIAKTRD
jgi:creatinine amidohydrolase